MVEHTTRWCVFPCTNCRNYSLCSWDLLFVVFSSAYAVQRYGISEHNSLLWVVKHAQCLLCTVSVYVLDSLQYFAQDNCSRPQVESNCRELTTQVITRDRRSRVITFPLLLSSTVDGYTCRRIVAATDAKQNTRTSSQYETNCTTRRTF